MADLDGGYEWVTAASIKVYKTGDGVSKGMWRQIAATNSMNIELEVGF